MSLNIQRTDWDTYFMLQAHLVATRSTCDRGPELIFDVGRHGVGAIIVKDRRIISTAYNGSPPGLPHCDRVGHLMIDGHCHRTLHSELNAIIQCALDGVSPEGGVIYCTASPCYDCAKAIIRAKIKKVVISEHYESRYGLSKDVESLLGEAGVEVVRMNVRLPFTAG